MPRVIVARVTLNNNHVYTIVVSEYRAELLLPTGKKRWSTISQSFINRIWNSSSFEEDKQKTLKSKLNEILFKLNVVESNRPENLNWKADKIKFYWKLESALKKEQTIIDKSVSIRGMDLQYQ